MTHDELCRHDRFGASLPEWCECDLIARVRADERGRMLTPHHPETYATAWSDSNYRAHAEAVAARLVEVIWEQEYEADRQGDQIIESQAAIIRSLTEERDAAREQRDRASAEHAAVRADAAAFKAERDAARAEVAALRERKEVYTDRAMAHGRREVLADLRAKVEGLPLVGEEQTPMWAKVYRQSVLALLDEAAQ